MHILMFLNDNNSAFITQDIANELDLWWTTVDYNLKALLECGFVKIVEDKKSGRKYYQITADKKAIEKVFIYYKKWVGVRLARLIPYNKIYTDQLKSDKRFVETCQHYGLRIGEGISAVLSCPKTGSETHSGRLIIWRKEQGYIPPEKEEIESIPKTKEQMLEEARSAIG